MGRPNVNWAVGVSTGEQTPYSSKVLKAGMPFSAQITDEDTKYIIKYDFDLDGETITIPENCTLDFDGGSVNNGCIIGNNTFLSGNIANENTINSLSGYYLDGNGEYLNFNKLPFTKVNIVKEIFNYSDEGIYLSGYYAASVCSDSDYIYQFITNSSNDSYVLLFTKGFSYIGKSHITTTCHCNSCFIKDSDLYITNMTKYVFHVKVENVRSNCSSGNETDVESISIDPNLHLYAIDYDANNDVIYGFTGIRDDDASIYVLDKNFSVVETYQHPALAVEEYLSHLKVNNIVYNNDYIVKNGLCFIGCSIGGNTETISLNAFSAVLAVVDIYKNKLIYSDRITSVQDFIECEGICYDKENDSIVISAKAVNFRETRCNGLIKLQIGANNMVPVKQTSYTMYIDNTFTGDSLGSPANPYKTINEAVCSNINASDHLVLFLRYTGIPYDCTLSTIRFRNILIEGRSSTYASGQPLSDPVVINVKSLLELYDDTSLEFRGVEVTSVSSGEIKSYGSTITFNRCSVKVKTSIYLSGIYFKDGCIVHNDINNMILANLSYIYCNSTTFADDHETNSIFILRGSKMYMTTCTYNANAFYSSNSNGSEIVLGAGTSANTFEGTIGGNYLQLSFIKVNADNATALASALALAGKAGSYNVQIFIPNNITLDGKLYTQGLYYKRGDVLVSVAFDNANKSGTTENRPTSLVSVGFQYFDTTLGKPIYYNGTEWVDATGTTV